MFPGSLSDLVVLCIGVGDGTQVREMAAEGSREVHGADISEVAFESIRHLLTATYLFPHFDEMPSNYFDVVFSRSVTCHLDAAAMRHHCEHAIRSLKPDGRFFLQETYSTEGKNTGDTEGDIPIGLLREGAVHRSYGYTANMLYQCGGVIVEPATVMPVEGPARIGWYGLTIQRADMSK